MPARVPVPRVLEIGPEAYRGVEGPPARPRCVRQRAVGVGGAIERGIVAHDDAAIARQVDVELHAIGAAGDAQVEGDQRVLRAQRASAPMREHERATGVRKREHAIAIAIAIGLWMASATNRNPRCNQQSDRNRFPWRPVIRPPSGACAAPWPPACRDTPASKTKFAATSSHRLRAGGAIFPGVVGYAETVVPQVINALLSKHNFILLGLRGQAKTRMLRALVGLLDEAIAVVAGCELRDDPFNPLCAACKARLATAGDDLPVQWLPREDRYVEKLATPDVTIADLIGDIDPIKAARSGRELGDEQTMHYGLLPRANRGIFAINELPDLAGKIQVGLFNILQEGDVQMKGYPVRLRLDVLMAFTANPEDYTARGKIITPLKDRIGSEIRTHYAATRDLGMEITSQEAWLDRRGDTGVIDVPSWVREIVEEIAFQARDDRRIDKRSGVSQRLPISVLENVASNAERRALTTGEAPPSARIADIYAALPAITGKFELEYEGELKGADAIAHELIRAAVATVFVGALDGLDTARIVEWFEAGGSLPLEDTTRAEDFLARAGAFPACSKACGLPESRTRPPRRSAPRQWSSSSKGWRPPGRSAAPASVGIRPPTSRPRAAPRGGTSRRWRTCRRWGARRSTTTDK